jgi:tripartite motif-containing protein 71
VLAYSTQGEYLYAWGDDRRARFTFPAAITLDADGNPFVVDVGTSRIQRFTPEGLPLDGWGKPGAEQTDLSGPWDMAVDGEGRIFIADGGNHRVQVFAADGSYVGAWGSQGSGPGQFQTPTGIEVGAEGSVYVVDSGNARVLRYDHNGVFVESWGGPGTAEGQFTTPWGIAIRGQTAFVSDSATGRIQAFDLDGNYLWSFSPGVAPHGIALDSSGWIYVADTGNSRVRVYTPQGIYAATIGTAGSGVEQLSGPYAVAVAADGTVYVADTGNARVQVYEATGEP